VKRFRGGLVSKAHRLRVQGSDLEEALAGLVLRHKAARDVLHEDGEVLAEPRPLLAEERRLRQAPVLRFRVTPQKCEAVPRRARI